MRASDADFKESAESLGDVGLTFRPAARRLGPPFASPTDRRPASLARRRDPRPGETERPDDPRGRSFQYRFPPTPREASIAQLVRA